MTEQSLERLTGPETGWPHHMFFFFFQQNGVSQLCWPRKKYFQKHDRPDTLSEARAAPPSRVTQSRAWPGTPTRRRDGTCADRLPAHGERGPGLDDVQGDGAVVVGPGSPGQLGGGVRDLVDGHGLRGAWRTCKGARPSELAPGVAFARPRDAVAGRRTVCAPPSDSPPATSSPNTCQVPASFRPLKTREENETQPRPPGGLAVRSTESSQVKREWPQNGHSRC